MNPCVRCATAVAPHVMPGVSGSIDPQIWNGFLQKRHARYGHDDTPGVTLSMQDHTDAGGDPGGRSATLDGTQRRADRDLSLQRPFLARRLGGRLRFSRRERNPGHSRLLSI
jgi:hypothetical protein